MDLSCYVGLSILDWLYHNRLEINPVGTAIAIGEAFGLSKYGAAPIRVSLERQIDSKSTMEASLFYMNGKVKEREGWFDEEGVAYWETKQVGVGGKLKWYSSKSFSGYYFGLSCNLFYSSLNLLETYSNSSEIYPGKGWFLSPGLEIGLQSYFTDRLSLNIGYNLELPLALSSTESHHKTYEYNSIGDLLVNGIIFNIGYSF